MSAGFPSNSVLVRTTTPSLEKDQSDRRVVLRYRVAGWLLQVSHRVGAIAMLATIGTWAIMYRVQNFHWALAIAAGASDVGLCAGLLARMLTGKTRSNHRDTATLRREATSVTIFNLVLFVLAMYFMLFARLSIIRANAAEFFTPTEQQ